MHCLNCGSLIKYKQEKCSRCGYEIFCPEEDIKVGVPANLLDVIKKIEVEGWRIHKKNGSPAEIIKGDNVSRIPFSVFAGLRKRKLIEPIAGSDRFILTYKAEAIAVGKWPHYSIRIPEEFRFHKERKA